MNDELISVIVPVYNVEKFLSRCLDSLLCQTYKNLEIILVNDGSTDSSEEICEHYSKIDDRVSVINKQNGGPGSARNVGFLKATGVYVSFIDSDDWIEPNFYEEMHHAIIENDVDSVRCNYIIDKNEYSNVVNGSVNVAGKKFNRCNEDYEKNVIIPLLSGQMPCYFTAYLTKKKFLDMQKPYVEDIFLMEDTIYLNNLMFNINSIYFLDMPLYHYWSNDSGITRNPDKYRTNIKNMPKVLKYFTDVVPHDSTSKNKYIDIRTSAIAKSSMSYIYYLYISLNNQKLFAKELDEILKDETFINILKKSNLIDLKFYGISRYLENFFLKLVINKNYKLLSFLYNFRKAIS